MSTTSRPSVHIHEPYRLPTCGNVSCDSDMDIESMEDDGAQIIPVSPEISVAYLCKKCFNELPLKDVLRMTRHYLYTEKGVFRKRLWQWRRGYLERDPCIHLEASILFLRKEKNEPPFSSVRFVTSHAIEGSPTITHHKHLARILFHK